MADQSANDSVNAALGENDELFDEMKSIVDEEHDDLEQFLLENKLHEHLSLFRDQQIDFETLMILTEPDLKSLGLPLGPFRKLINALRKKKVELNMEVEGLDESVKSEKEKEEGELPALGGEGNFTVIDESGDDSDAASVKSEHGTGKKKEESGTKEPDKNHPYSYDLSHFVLADEFKMKVELQEPTSVDDKNFELITDERRMKSMIRALRKEKVIAVDSKHVDTYVRTMTLMQISTQNSDYIIDFSKHNHLILLLTDVFTNPNILKVFFDAKSEICFLQRYYNLYTLNVYCVRNAVKELKYENNSLYSLINKYSPYFKPANNECLQRPLRNDLKLNLRKETHYLLHIYYKTRNEAIEAGRFDAIASYGASLCASWSTPLKPRTPANMFSDYEKFNDAQKFAAEELAKWRDSVAKDKDVNPYTILQNRDFKTICLSLPIKKDELLSMTDSRVVRLYFQKIVGILKTARKKYFNDPNVPEGKYDLKPIENVSKQVTTPVSANNNSGGNSNAGGNSANRGVANKNVGGVGNNKRQPLNKVSPRPLMKGKMGMGGQNDGMKRKADNFASPGPAGAKKPRFKTRRNFGNNTPTTKRNSFDNKNKVSPFRTPRGGYNNSGNKNFQNQPKYQQNVWEPAHNFNNSYGGGGGFKYY